jgi:xanthosine utilization system XapX-like protein
MALKSATPPTLEVVDCLGVIVRGDAVQKVCTGIMCGCATQRSRTGKQHSARGDE